MAHYPHIRHSTSCPTCGATKAKGLLFCWPCGRANKRWLGDEHSPAVVANLNLTEIKLEDSYALRLWRIFW